jgi:hypothetical protein
MNSLFTNLRQNLNSNGDPFVNQVVDVNGLKLIVRKKLAEGESLKFQ